MRGAGGQTLHALGAAEYDALLALARVLRAALGQAPCVLAGLALHAYLVDIVD